MENKLIELTGSIADIQVSVELLKRECVKLRSKLEYINKKIDENPPDKTILNYDEFDDFYEHKVIEKYLKPTDIKQDFCTEKYYLNLEY